MNASWFVAGKVKLFPWPQKLIQGPHHLNPHHPTPNQWGWLSFLLTHRSPGFISQLVPQVKNGSKQNPRSLGIRALHMALWEVVWGLRPPALSSWPGSSHRAEYLQFAIWNGSLNNSRRCKASRKHRAQMLLSPRPPIPHLLLKIKHLRKFRQPDGQLLRKTGFQTKLPISYRRK